MIGLENHFLKSNEMFIGNKTIVLFCFKSNNDCIAKIIITNNFLFQGYRPCAKRASILFFVLTDMANIDPMYQFSLDSYINIFLMSIEKSKKTEVLEDRIANLNDYHTYAFYR